MKNRFVVMMLLFALVLSARVMAQSTIEKTGKKVESGAKQTGDATVKGTKKVGKVTADKSKEAGKVTAEKSKEAFLADHALMEFGAELRGGAYRLRSTFVRTSGNDTVGYTFPVGKSGVTLTL